MLSYCWKSNGGRDGICRGFGCHSIPCSSSITCLGAAPPPIRRHCAGIRTGGNANSIPLSVGMEPPRSTGRGGGGKGGRKRRRGGDQQHPMSIRTALPVWHQCPLARNAIGKAVHKHLFRARLVSPGCHRNPCLAESILKDGSGPGAEFITLYSPRKKKPTRRKPTPFCLLCCCFLWPGELVTLWFVLRPASSPPYTF